MRCPKTDLVYTGYVDGRELLQNISDKSQAVLRESAFITPFDEYSRDSNSQQVISERHGVLENAHSFRYYDTRTRPEDPTSARHWKALMDLRDAMAKARGQSHRIEDGDLLVIANQDSLHCRRMVEVNDPESTRLRWLLKTYAFRDEVAADRHCDAWLDNVGGRVLD